MYNQELEHASLRQKLLLKVGKGRDFFMIRKEERDSQEVT